MSARIKACKNAYLYCADTDLSQTNTLSLCVCVCVCVSVCARTCTHVFPLLLLPLAYQQEMVPLEKRFVTRIQWA